MIYVGLLKNLINSEIAYRDRYNVALHYCSGSYLQNALICKNDENDDDDDDDELAMLALL